MSLELARDETLPAPAIAPRLSALVVAHDEEAQLPGCLEALRFADEIVVVLDRCTDQSRAVAESFGARILEGSWEREGDRRNTGIAACTGDWILEVDADERVSSGLADEIRRTLPGAAPGHYLVRFRNFIGRRPVVHGWGAYNGVARKPCLFARGCKTWERQRVHPRIHLGGPRGELNGTIDHYVDADLSDMLRRLDGYTTKAALDAIDAGERPRLTPALRRLFSRFWKVYVARRGYREGPYGLALGLFSALYPLLTYLKVATHEAPPSRGEPDGG